MAAKKPLMLIKIVAKFEIVLIKAGFVFVFCQSKKMSVMQRIPLNASGISAYKSLKKDLFLIFLNYNYILKQKIHLKNSFVYIC